MKLTDKLKRIEIFTHDQRLIVIFSIVLCVLFVGILLYTPYQLAIVPVAIIANYILLSRILISKKISHIITRALRPTLWILICFGYLFTIHVIYLVPVVVFTLLSILIMAGYGAMMFLQIRSRTSQILDNVLHIVTLLIGVSLASLLLSYWYFSVVAVLLGLWAAAFLLAFVWLLNFTTKPQIIAGTWALIVVEIFWITSRWINLYSVPKTSLLISQAAILIVALAYGFGGMYYHYKSKTLRKSLLFEYIGVTTVVFVALMLLSKWTVAI